MADATTGTSTRTPPTSSSRANLSQVVKEMVKEMDANDFYSRSDMYDDSAEEPWFNIRISLKRADGEPAIPAASLRKPWSEFQRLHYLLLTDEFGCDEDVKAQLPSLPSGLPPITNGGSDGDRKINADVVAGGLDAYMKALLAVPAVVQSEVFCGFLEAQGSRCEEREEGGGGGDVGGGWSGGSRAEKVNNIYGDTNIHGTGGESDGGAPRTPETAVDFLLQPFDYGQAYVRRRSKHTERIDVLRGESVVWKFEVLDHLDINFSVVFRPHPVPLSPLVPEVTTCENDGAEPSTPMAGVEGNASLKTTTPSKPNRGSGRSGWWGNGSGGDSNVGQRGEAKAECGAKAGGAAAGGSERERALAPKKQIVHLPTRYSTGGGDLVQGSFTCPADGTCILRWDNSYSRLRGKRLRFVVESATVATMRAAIEAAGATEHKRRNTRSAAARAILDSDQGEVRVSVMAVGIGDDLGREAEDKKLGDGSDSGGNAGVSYYYPSQYRFGRVRRIAATLLRDLGTMLDAHEAADGVVGEMTATNTDSDLSSGGVLRTAGTRASVDARGVETLVARFEVLEDEVAAVSARRAQCEAQAKVLLANLQKANTKVDRLERALAETRELLSVTRRDLGEIEATRDEALAEAKRVGSRLQTSEEQLLRSKRELDLLKAEQSVWQVARSGIQEELSKVVAELEIERHRHEDTSRALAKSHESRAHAETEAARLSRRLEKERGGAGGARAALAAEREASRLAREEAEDARAAVAELDAAVAELGAQKRVLVTGLRARERALGDRCAAAEARAEEAGMMRRAAEARVRELEEEAERREAAQADGEIRLQRLRAEKKILLAEIRRGASGGGNGGTGSGPSVGGAGIGIEEKEKGRETGEEGLGDSGSEGGSGSVGGGGSQRGLLSPRGTGDSAQNRKATLKQLSRQLVHLRERQHHLREDLRSDPNNTSAQRLEADVDRAVQNLETRIKRLLSVVSGERVEEASSASALSSPPGEVAMKRSITVSPVETSETAEVETYSV